MSSVREALREVGRLKRMRLGQQVSEFVELASLPTDLRLAMVPLTEAEAAAGVVIAANMDVGDNFAGISARNRAAQVSDVYHSLRDPSDLTQLAFDSIDDMIAVLDPSDVDVAFDQLTALMSYSSPKLDGLDDEQLANLKKGFAQMDLSALSGRQWALLKLFIQALTPELLDSWSGSTSTEPSTETSESDESTPTA